MSQDEPASEAQSSRQFSLRSLLWFVVLTSLWCSQIAVVRGLVLSNTHLLAASSVASVLVAWIVMSWYSLRQRLFIIFTFQCVFPAIIGLWTLGQCVDNPTRPFSDLFDPFFGVAFCANLIWFPAAAITMAARWAWPAVTAKQHDRGMPWWP